MLLSQTLPGLVEPGADAVYPPAGAALSDLRPPPTPFEVASAITVARMKMQAAADKSVAALPKMPWTERGLADVEIKREQIRFDAKRGKYVASVAGGRLAVLSLEPRILIWKLTISRILSRSRLTNSREISGDPLVLSRWRSVEILSRSVEILSC